MNFDRGYTESYTNVVLRFHLDSQTWSPLQYAHSFRALGQYISGNDTLIAGGDADGQVIQLNHPSNTDYGNVAIKFLLESPEFDFSRREVRKTIHEKIYCHADGTSGALLMVRLDYGEWKSIGSLKDIVTPVPISPITAHVFQFRIVNSHSGEIIKIRGLDFPAVEVHNS